MFAIVVTWFRPQQEGGGLATAMCKHSQEIAKELGYKAMQFNFVASSNEGALRLWNKLGFKTVGRLPKAFNHPTQDYVDALVMYKWLNITRRCCRRYAAGTLCCADRPKAWHYKS